MNNNYTGADLGPTKAMRGYLDKYAGFKVIGLSREGTVDFNENRATPQSEKNFANSVDIEKYGLHQHLGLPYPDGVTGGGNDTKVDMQRVKGVVVDRNRGNKPVEGIWLEMYEAAEKAYKA
jgi:hypothetical protein